MTALTFFQDWGTDGGGKNLAVQLPRFPDELGGFEVSTTCQIDRVTACFPPRVLALADDAQVHRR